jgi:hypothetical protein
MIKRLYFIGYGHYYLTYKKQFQQAIDFDENRFESYVYRSAMIVPILVFSFPVMALLLHMLLIAFPVSFPMLISVQFAVPIGFFVLIRKQYYLDDKTKQEVVDKFKLIQNKRIMIVYTVLLVAVAISFFVGSIYISTLDWYPRNYF